MGLPRFLAKPSSVATCAPEAIVLHCTTQERVSTPLTITVQAPHCAMPQANFGPFWPSLSRRTNSRGSVSSAIGTVAADPSGTMLRVIAAGMLPCPFASVQRSLVAREGRPAGKVTELRCGVRAFFSDAVRRVLRCIPEMD